jgi:hypothetical protein
MVSKSGPHRSGFKDLLQTFSKNILAPVIFQRIIFEKVLGALAEQQTVRYASQIDNAE